MYRKRANLSNYTYRNAVPAHKREQKKILCRVVVSYGYYIHITPRAHRSVGRYIRIKKWGIKKKLHEGGIKE
jgi:hypothetical protein